MMQNNKLDGMPEYKLLYTQVARKMVGTNISVVKYGVFVGPYGEKIKAVIPTNMLTNNLIGIQNVGSSSNM